ncbi:uncharacterized protein B0T23DRAFT_401863 [Neurospora hispaniola]|uniref:NACHT domain-containing protein n=1 Tax=Neurospora hispaniola TaxID=588809 RepID=A0AAJ0IHL3_9PEZI|nr:hypothetical protein B0T23DRAFT_401863 [Neurospora hispaniola]
MSGLEAFGLACNVMQTIGFAIEMASVCHSIFRTGSPDPSMATLLAHSTQITTSLKSSISSARPVTRDDKELLDIANKCLDAMSALKVQVDKLTRPSAKGKVLPSLRLGLRAKFKQGNIDKLEKKMRDYQKVLESGLLLRICTLQCFVEAVSRGQDNLQDLMKSTHDSIVEVVKAESTVQNAATTVIASEVKKTQAMIKETSLEASAEEKRQRLLKSLKYDTMSERLGQVKAAFAGTCRWMIQSAPNSIQSVPDGENLTPVCPHRTTHENNLSWSCFPCWLESPKDKIYWIQGKAGSGKSTLMKFLVTNPALWHPQRQADGQDLILSHFLWAAGSPLQKSLRGILLNLLYQLLSNDEHALDHVIDTFPDLKLKDFWGDWTLEDLDRTMMDSLHTIATRPVFIFLDGLDDRPEAVFKNKLGGLCSLRLQDLTRSDMAKYAKAELLSNEVVGLENQKEYQKLVNKLCNMADGVFLWTALAVRSLSRGLTNEDDISELYARLEKMPTGLYPLYKDMWERLNEDQHLYRKEAALYFQLVIHWGRMPSHAFEKRCTTFHLLAARDPSISRAYLNHDTASLPANLEALCEKLGKRVETRSAGLLEHGDYGSIDFIHRSALEFLTDSPEGQRIMAHDTSTFSELRSWLLQADVARAYLMFMKPVNPHIFRHWHSRCPDDSAFDSTELMEDVHLNWDDSALPGDVQIMLLEACRRILEVDDIMYTRTRPFDFAGSHAAHGRGGGHRMRYSICRRPLDTWTGSSKRSSGTEEDQSKGPGSPAEEER